MIEIQDMTRTAADELLEEIGYGHLGCSLGDRPYVVPIHYSYDNPDIYIYTTAGKKSEMIAENPLVCLQVEDVVDDGSWRSVLVTGTARELKAAEREEPMKIILADNPNLTPAVSLRWKNNWITENIEVIYKLTPSSINGRFAVRVEMQAAASGGGDRRRARVK